MPNLTRRQWLAVGRYFEMEANALSRGRELSVPATRPLRAFYRLTHGVYSVEFFAQLALLAYFCAEAAA